MLIGDRVVCNSCLSVIGQLFNVAPYQSDFLADLTQPPYYTVCPDCLESSAPVLQLQEPQEHGH